ncbi:MAG: hypothetical protein MUD01_05735 [Chloroflexaceae bacterium]|jgi:hypothetical protein|nr:hypothetical protein [Chloroflexaceae bacterium]
MAHEQRPLIPLGIQLLVLFVLIPLFTCLGVMVGMGLLYANTLWQARWQSLGTPPEAATAFVSVDSREVTVRTVSGALFTCPEDGENCWQQLPPNVAAPVQKESNPCQPAIEWNVLPPPGQVMERRNWEECYSDAAVFVEYVRLSDGSIWRWDDFISSYLGLGSLALALVCGAMLGAVVGLLLGGLLLWYMGRRLRAMATSPS